MLSPPGAQYGSGTPGADKDMSRSQGQCCYTPSASHGDGVVFTSLRPKAGKSVPQMPAISLSSSGLKVESRRCEPSSRYFWHSGMLPSGMFGVGSIVQHGDPIAHQFHMAEFLGRDGRNEAIEGAQLAPTAEIEALELSKEFRSKAWPHRSEVRYGRWIRNSAFTACTTTFRMGYHHHSSRGGVRSVCQTLAERLIGPR